MARAPRIDLVLVTVPTLAVAEELARALIAERRAACVNIVPGIRSLYTWKGELCDEAEVLLLIKCPAKNFPALRRAIFARHPYEVPEIVALPIARGHRPYLDWVQSLVTHSVEKRRRDKA